MDATVFGSHDGKGDIDDLAALWRCRQRQPALDLRLMAEQLIADYRHGGEYPGLAVWGTLDSWMGMAEALGQPFTPVDWMDLARVLARRAAAVTN